MFNSNQFKVADNIAPTADPDIRYSLNMGGYNPDIQLNSADELKKYNIDNLYNHNEVIKKVADVLKGTYLSAEEQAKPIKNIDTGMNIEIWRKGIKETFGNPKYYDNLTVDEKKAKIASISQLAK